MKSSTGCFKRCLKYSTTYYNKPVGCDFQIFISKIKNFVKKSPEKTYFLLTKHVITKLQIHVHRQLQCAQTMYSGFSSNEHIFPE